MQWKYLISFVVFWQVAMKDYQEKKMRGELISQKVDFLKQNILSPVNQLTLVNNTNNH